ncbi:hypothetical protein UY3_13217 [Chelonia mydas]|uniref:Uncharacterized protein n=1 Tax=Chelonia mydas TaxID=8469 RepID=M7BBY6_CHEMY|nr:hypothetical protein UY3_13217 [Chelonia mydas]
MRKETKRVKESNQKPEDGKRRTSHRAMLWNYSIEASRDSGGASSVSIRSPGQETHSFDLPESDLGAFSIPFHTMHFPQRVHTGSIGDLPLHGGQTGPQKAPEHKGAYHHTYPMHESTVPET